MFIVIWILYILLRGILLTWGNDSLLNVAILGRNPYYWYLGIDYIVLWIFFLWLFCMICTFAFRTIGNLNHTLFFTGWPNSLWVVFKMLCFIWTSLDGDFCSPVYVIVIIGFMRCLFADLLVSLPYCLLSCIILTDVYFLSITSLLLSSSCFSCSLRVVGWLQAILFLLCPRICMLLFPLVFVLLSGHLLLFMLFDPLRMYTISNCCNSSNPPSLTSPSTL